MALMQAKERDDAERVGTERVRVAGRQFRQPKKGTFFRVKAETSFSFAAYCSRSSRGAA